MACCLLYLFGMEAKYMALTWQTADRDETSSAQYLTLRRGPAGWLVDWSQTARAGAVRELFGSAMVPTSYTLEASAVDVYAKIKRLNPEYLIYVGR